MSTYIAPVSWGLGDLIVSLPAVFGLLDRGNRVVLVTRSAYQLDVAQRIAGGIQTVDESEFSQRGLRDGDVLVNLRDHSLQKDHWWGSRAWLREYPELLINDILRTICADFGVAANFDECRPLDFERREAMESSVVFVPGSDGPYKRWDVASWTWVWEKLRDDGRRCLVVGQREKSADVASLVDAGMSHVETPKLSDAIDVISSCGAVVGVDTGLTHIAVQQRVPTVGIYPSFSVYRRYYSHVINLLGGLCADECQDRFENNANNTMTILTGWDPPPWECRASAQKSCVNNVTAEDVYRSVTRLLNTDRRSHANSDSGPRACSALKLTKKESK